VYGDELSDFFEDRILDNYSTDAQDGSCREVADKIVRQFEPLEWTTTTGY